MTTYTFTFDIDGDSQSGAVDLEKIVSDIADLTASLGATDTAILSLATKDEVSSVENMTSAVVNKTGSPYTVLATDLGKSIEVDRAVTLPVLNAASVRKRIDLINVGTKVTLTLASGVTLAVKSATAIDQGAAVSLYLESSTGTNAVWRVIGGRA